MTTADITAPGTNVEQVLREGGLSRFHKKAILVTGAAWTFVAMEILLVGFVAPTFTAIWHLDGRMQGLVNSAALAGSRSEEHTSELQSRLHLVCRLLLEKK